MNKTKKAQVTIFIIIGIIILVGVGLYLGLSGDVMKERLKIGTKTKEKVPLEFVPVNDFIEGCLEDISIEGLVKIGERGGFIDLIENNIIAKADATNSDAVIFSPNSEYKVAYWWYLKSDNKCSGNCRFEIIPDNRLFLSKNVGKASIEEQLERYINENLEECLDGFKALKKEGFEIKEKSRPDASVTVAESDILVVLDYIIEAKKESKKELSRFLVRIPLNIRKIYELAKMITELEAEYKFLERDVLNLIVGFSGLDSNKLPPMSDVRFRIGKMISWRKSRIKEKIIRMLSEYIKMLRVYGTKNYREFSFGGDALLESLYNRGMLVPGSEEYSNLEVRFNYNPFWPIYFDLDCNGDVCKPESLATKWFAMFGIQNYNFVYDLSFPVEVEIYDPYALDNRGYHFKFFLEGNIRNNEPMESNFVRTSAIKLFERSMLCDSDKRNSGNITIEVKDVTSGEGIDDVSVIFTSGSENCLIGTTKNGSLVERFPVLYGGIVNFVKNGYVGYSKRFDTRLDKSDNLSVYLTPILKKKFGVKKKVMLKRGDNWVFGEERNLSVNEEAEVVLRRLGSKGEEEISFYSVYKGNQNSSEIEIAPGKYEINIELVYNKNWTIPSHKIKAGSKEYTIPGSTIGEGFRIGGLLINYTFTNKMLESDEIIFLVLNPDIISIKESERRIEDLGILSNLDSYSQMYRGILVPRFK